MTKKEDCYKIGEIIRPHGLQGDVVAHIDEIDLLDFIEEPIFFLLEGGVVPFFISHDRVSVKGQSTYIVKFDFIESKEDAERFSGTELFIDNSIVEILDDPDDHNAIIGFSIFDETNSYIGDVVDVIDYNGNVVILILSDSGEILLPYMDEFILKIDSESRAILAYIPEELLTLNFKETSKN